MFIEDKDFLEFKVYYKKYVHSYDAYTEKEFEKVELKEEDKKKFKEVVIKMSELTWGLYNQLQDCAMIEGGDGERHFNFKIYKENRLNKLIKEWNATDAAGKPVPVNDKTISHLAPSIAESILRGYDELSFISEEDEKKS